MKKVDIARQNSISSIRALRVVYRMLYNPVQAQLLKADRLSIIRAVYDLSGTAGVSRSVRLERNPFGLKGAELLRPKSLGLGSNIKTILYIHGGGFVLGSTKSHRNVASHLAAICQVPVLTFNYRLAPEARYPACVDDVVAVYQQLLENGRLDSAEVAVAGDSAGAALALELMLRCKAREAPMPRAGVLFCPHSDYRGDLPKASDKLEILLSPDILDGFSKYTAADRSQKLANDLLEADYSDLPPLLLQVGTGDVLYNEGVQLHQVLEAQGCAGKAEYWQDMPHNWHSFYGILPEARAALENVSYFLRSLQ